jgi:hypothetical protein
MSDSDFNDDPSIADSTELWRRIHPSQIVFDGTLGRKRPSSASYKGVELSVVVSDSGRTPAEVLLKFPSHSLASILAGLARSKSQRLVRQPTADEPAHGLIVGQKPKSVLDDFAKNARWLILRSN